MDLHRTPTIDLNVVVQGALTLVLPDEEVRLETGDLVVVGGVDHTWRPDPELGATMVFFNVGIVGT